MYYFLRVVCGQVFLVIAVFAASVYMSMAGDMQFAYVLVCVVLMHQEVVVAVCRSNP